MPKLRNTKHEALVIAVVSGKSPLEAGLQVGYSKIRAKISANAVLRRPEVRARREELEQLATQQALAGGSLTKKWVIDRLLRNIEDASIARQYNTVTRCLELLGREVGAFREKIDHKLEWDGDPRSLTDGQLEKLIEYHTVLAFPNPDERRKVLEGEVIVEQQETAGDGW